jgi:hypothetical protein
LANRYPGTLSSEKAADDAPTAASHITREGLVGIIREGAIHPDFYIGADWVNQHWLHSLQQFYAEKSVAWRQHCERTDALLGTPSGRLPRGDRQDGT